MAEVAGLAFGTVALASLFSACVDLIGYFELSKSFEYDYNVACLKLSLLKAKLDTCGKTLSIEDAVHEPQELRQNWSKEQDVIVRSLLGIKNILGNAELLKDKYKLVPHKPNPLSTLLAILAKSSTVADHSSPGPSRPPNSSRRLLLFRQSTVWAIRDRQKFDALLSDLEFFISNLEHVVSRLMMSKQHKEKDRSPVDCDVEMTDEPPENGQVGTVFGDSKGHSKEKQENSIANPREGGHSWSKGGRDFEIKETSGQATYVQGVQGIVKDTSIAPRQRDSFTVAKMEDQSLGMQGYNSVQSISKVLQQRQAMITAIHSDKSNGSRNVS